MKCFYDPSKDAIGTCKCCGRGLSAGFVTEFPKGLACKDRCEADVRSLITLIDNNVAMSSTSATLVKGSQGGFYASFLLYLVMAASLIWMGSRDQQITPIFYMGLAFGAFALYVLARGLKISQAAKKI